MDELLLRQMPHSTEAEQAVLGSMLIDAACVKDVMDQLQPDDFYLRQNREIFETIYTMFVYSRPIDGLTVAGELEKAGLANDGTRAYLAQLMEVTPTSANVLEYVRLVREKALLRSVAAAAAEITAMVQEGTGSAGDLLEAAEQKIYAIRRGRNAQSMVTIGVVLQDVMERLAELTAAIQSVIRFHEEPTDDTDLLTAQQIVNILTLICTETDRTGAEISALGSKLKQILHYLDEHYTETISLDFLAEEFYISKYYLAREFKKEYGTTIIRYVLAKKITHAKELLRYSNSSIEEIARLCGMDDASYFNKVFKKMEGCTASEYRKQW